MWMNVRIILSVNAIHGVSKCLYVLCMRGKEEDVNAEVNERELLERKTFRYMENERNSDFHL